MSPPRGALAGAYASLRRQIHQPSGWCGFHLLVTGGWTPHVGFIFSRLVSSSSPAPPLPSSSSPDVVVITAAALLRSSVAIAPATAGVRILGWGCQGLVVLGWGFAGVPRIPFSDDLTKRGGAAGGKPDGGGGLQSDAAGGGDAAGWELAAWQPVG